MVPKYSGRAWCWKAFSKRGQNDLIDNRKSNEVSFYWKGCVNACLEINFCLCVAIGEALYLACFHSASQGAVPVYLDQLYEHFQTWFLE